MTSKYSGRDDDLLMQIAELTRRITRLESIGRVEPGAAGVVTDTEYNTPATTITTGSFTNMFHIHGSSARIGVFVHLRVITPAATTVEVRIVDESDSTVVSPVPVVPASSNAHLHIGGRRTDLVPFSHSVVQARLASGVGTSRIAVLLAAQGDYRAETF
jgi:hypothetical protein